MRTRDEIIRRYLDYLEACNRRAWDELRQFLSPSVLVNGQPRTRTEYVADITATTAVFPDYRWKLRRAVVENDWLAVHLYGTGTRTRPFWGAPGDGTYVETDEFDMYRMVAGLITEVEGTTDNAKLRS